MADTAFSNVTNYDLLTIGSGNREDPTNRAVKDRLFALRDTLVNGNIPNNFTPLTTADLFDATSNVIQEGSSAQALIDLKAARGWYINLTKAGALIGEKSLAGTLILDGVAYYTTYVPIELNVTGPVSCAPQEGLGRLYAVNALNATAVFDTNEDGVLNGADRVKALASGISPEPVLIFTDSGDSVEGNTIDSTKIITQLEMSDPNFRRPRVKTYWYHQ